MDKIEVSVELYARIAKAIDIGMKYIPLGDSGRDFCRAVLRDLKGEPERFICGCVVGQCAHKEESW